MLIEPKNGIEIVADLPALYIREMDSLVVADLHIGFEEEAASQGLFIPFTQYNHIINVIDKALDRTNASHIIFLGDVKHSFSSLLRTERRDLTKLFNHLKSRWGVNITIIRGNHDSFLTLIARKHGIKIVDELYYNGILFIHGHRKPSGNYPENPRIIIMGHEHPSIKLRDKLGFYVKMQSFIFAPMKNTNTRVIVLPALGQYQTGSSITLDPSSYLSPILREDVILEEIKPYVIVENLGVLPFPQISLLRDLLEEVYI